MLALYTGRVLFPITHLCWFGPVEDDSVEWNDEDIRALREVLRIRGVGLRGGPGRAGPGVHKCNDFDFSLSRLTHLGCDQAAFASELVFIYCHVARDAFRACARARARQGEGNTASGSFICSDVWRRPVIHVNCIYYLQKQAILQVLLRMHSISVLSAEPGPTR